MFDTSGGKKIPVFVFIIFIFHEWNIFPPFFAEDNKSLEIELSRDDAVADQTTTSLRAPLEEEDMGGWELAIKATSNFQSRFFFLFFFLAHPLKNDSIKIDLCTRTFPHIWKIFAS